MRRVSRVGEGMFEFLDEIAVGGQAKVFKARELRFPRRELAIKYISCLPEELTKGNPSLWDRFKREAQTWSEFARSPYVVPLLGTFVEEVPQEPSGDLIYLGFVMEYSPLGDLSRFIGKTPQLARGKKDLLNFLLTIARAIKTGHDKDIVHGDIKPKNVILYPETGAPIPKVMDFGMSISAQEVSSSYGYGTPEYLAPELFHDSKPTKAGDVYALGILFFEVLSGLRPFCAPGVTTIQNRWDEYRKLHAQGKVTWDSIGEKYSHAVIELVKRMLSRDADDRPRIADVARSLDKLIEEERIRSIADPDGEALVRPKYYRWNPKVHEILGNQLHYYVIGSRSPHSDSTWLRNSLRDHGLHGYSLYRVLGGYDYILRIWTKQAYTHSIQGVMDSFRDSQGGNNMRFIVKEQWNSHGAKNISFRNEDEILTAILKSANKDHEAKFKELKSQGLVLSTLAVPKRFHLRFFLTVHTGEQAPQGLLRAFAREFSAALKEQGIAQSVSIYIGEGSFGLLIKFRLQRFEQFREVVDIFQLTSQELRTGNTVLRSQTFLELDEKGIVESDDGSIIAEVNKIGI